MKVTILQPALKQALQTASRMTPSKTFLPVLKCVLLRTVDGSLTVTATDLEAYAIQDLGAKVETEGAALLPVDLLSSLIASLPDEPVTLTLNEKTLTTKIECGSIKASIRGLDPEEYPAIPTAEPRWQMDAATLKAALSQVLFSAADDNTRPVLKGVLFEGNADRIRLVAANGFTMALATVNAPAENLTAIVPGRKLSEFARMLPAEGLVSFGLSETKSQIVFKFDKITFGSRLIEGQFPPYERVLPTPSGTVIQINVPQLVAAIKTALPFAADNSMILRLAASESGLVISSQSAETGESEIPIAAKVDGPEIMFNLNARYLLETIQACGSDSISMWVSSPASPVLLRITDSDQWQAVVMPMHTNR